MTIRRDFQSVFTSMVDAFSGYKDVQSSMWQGRNMNEIMDIFVANDQPPLYSEIKYEPQ